MGTAAHVLGIDIGSVAASCVELDRSGRTIGTGYASHQGRIRETLASLLDRETLARVRWVAATSATRASVPRSLTVDPQVACIAAARHHHPEVRALLHVGGERFSLTRFDAAGEYEFTRTNSSCAAGTGSFLDQQARVLGLADGAALATEALRARGEPPRIASRCAVFARTDLIHAQQEGHSVAEICRGLCEGLADIVADTLTSGEPVPEPVVFSGGVARNRAVRACLEARLGVRLVVDGDAHLHGALGAALRLLADLDRGDVPEVRLASVEELVGRSEDATPNLREPLELTRSEYPDFSGENRYEYRPEAVPGAFPVEVDVYRTPEPGRPVEAFVGIDVGSTSTKAALVGAGGEMLVGAYTRTAGRPLAAAQGILEALDSFARATGVSLSVRGAGTTGSGRKLVGSVVAADLVVDEITAHARAACELDPETDTIIEIGGQDSKFTTLANGVVTSAVMNTVCAAGTGSFIEEQARRFDSPVEACADLALGIRAPPASSRCTVFMQRDVNHLLGKGHSVREILATTLHSIAENYLEKVAPEGRIGRHIAFQGATAKNRALVAAFEQRLARPIRVSRYCHLTGALGVALLLAEAPPAESSFRGLSLHRERIPIRKEVCSRCRNHCKIVAAEVRGETASYGYLCGRDPAVERSGRVNASGFDLLRTRRRILRGRPGRAAGSEVVAGIPAALYLFDELELWRRFFANLGVRVVTGERWAGAVRSGKRLERAEFCAPMAAWHGHLDRLAERADFIFAPTCLDARPRDRGAERQYCYYSQHASALADTITGRGLSGKVVRPLVHPGFADLQTKWNLYSALKPRLGDEIGLLSVAQAYADAVDDHARRRDRLKEVMRKEAPEGDEIAVVLIGRPYVCLDPGMNKGVPDILGALGVKTFFMDMLDYDERDVEPIADLLGQVRWHYAMKILEAAYVVAKTPSLYPVFATSFKCSPDSMIREFFRRIMDAAGKPYLVLELDEHDSSVGYETRIEAAVRSFVNHRASAGPRPRDARPKMPERVTRLDGRTLFLPCWDRISCSLAAANLRKEGIDAHVVEEDEHTIREGLRKNTGECVPLNAIVQSFLSTVERRGLDPGRTALWMFDSTLPCNIAMYPPVIKTMFEARGGGFERAAVYCGDLSYIDLSVRATVNTYFAYMFGGMLRRLTCRVRPYEIRAGEADAAAEAGLRIFTEAFEGRRDKRDAAREVVDRFAAIETGPRRRPKVAIFGDMYARDNEVMSQDLIRFIERHGGEVLTTPYSEYLKIIAEPYFYRWFREGRLLSILLNRSLLEAVRVLEREYEAEFARVLGPRRNLRPRRSPQERLALFGLTDRHTGESFENILKVFHILENEPDVRLFVQANPAFCCPSLVTEAMAGRIRELTGVPVVTVTYDGTAASRNDAIIPHLELAREVPKSARTGTAPGGV